MKEHLRSFLAPVKDYNKGYKDGIEAAAQACEEQMKGCHNDGDICHSRDADVIRYLLRAFETTAQQ
jgi:hypothetical protein